MWPCSNLREMSRTMSISFMATSVCGCQQSMLSNEFLRSSFLCGAFAEKLGDIEIHEIGVMENNRLDGALHLIALVTVRGNDVHDFAGDAVLVGKRDAGEWMPHLLPKCSLNHLARRILIVLQRFAHIGQQRAGDEVV